MIVDGDELVRKINEGRDVKVGRAIGARLDASRVKNLCAALRVREVSSAHASLDACDAEAGIESSGSIRDRLRAHVAAGSFGRGSGWAPRRASS